MSSFFLKEERGGLRNKNTVAIVTRFNEVMKMNATVIITTKYKTENKTKKNLTITFTFCVVGVDSFIKLNDLESD